MGHKNWAIHLNEEIKKDYYKNILLFLKNEQEKGKVIYPEKDNWFNILNMNPDKIKVVIIGQDPYHGPGQAHGYSFSVKKGIKIPPSLKNIYQEIENEYNCSMPKNNGNLNPWIEQGVFLMNSILTVEKGIAASHKNIGWEIFTDNLIKIISSNYDNIVFLLWGKFAENKKNLIDSNKHLILTSAHPSFYSCQNFFGNNHFIKANDYLTQHNKEKINWIIQEE